MIPHPNIPPLVLSDDIALYPFGFLVGVAIIVGTVLAERRAVKTGLSGRVVSDVALWAVVVGFIGAHIFSAVFYFWDRLVADPLYIFMVWDGISSFGGFIGGTVAVAYYFNRRSRLTFEGGRLKRVPVKSPPFWPYADAIIYGFAFAWIFGRLGCTIAFDHPGVETDFFLAMVREPPPDLRPIGAWLAGIADPRLAFLRVAPRIPPVIHNLGFYEFLWAVCLSGFFFLNRKKSHFSGWYLMVFVITYMPIRFGLDFLRTKDTRYLELTAGQWAAIALFLVGIWFWFKRRRVGDIVTPDGQPHILPDGSHANPDAEEARERARAARPAKSGKKKGKRR